MVFSHMYVWLQLGGMGGKSKCPAGAPGVCREEAWSFSVWLCVGQRFASGAATGRKDSSELRNIGKSSFFPGKQVKMGSSPL